jgi:DnaJ-class molecular chaperone
MSRAKIAAVAALAECEACGGSGFIRSEDIERHILRNYEGRPDLAMHARLMLAGRPCPNCKGTGRPCASAKGRD